MAADRGRELAELLQRKIQFRRKTLRKILSGQIKPVNSRLRIAEQRYRLLHNLTSTAFTSGLYNDRPSEQTNRQQDEGLSPESDIAESVEIDVSSPVEDSIHAANALAEKYPDAEKITLKGDRIEVEKPSGVTFEVAVADVLRRELGQETETKTVEASTPIMGDITSDNKE